MKQTFWGYKGEEEAKKHWDLDSGIRTEDTIAVCSKEKHCTGSLDNKTFMYSDGSKDNGREIKQTTVIIGNDKIIF
jgi:hypothetical protein